MSATTTWTKKVTGETLEVSEKIRALKEELDNFSNDFHALAGALRIPLNKAVMEPVCTARRESPVELLGALETAATGLSALDWGLGGIAFADGAGGAVASKIVLSATQRVINSAQNMLRYTVLSDDAKLHLAEALRDSDKLAEHLGISPTLKTELVIALNAAKNEFREKNATNENVSIEAERKFMAYTIGQETPKMKELVEFIAGHVNAKERGIIEKCQEIEAIAKGTGKGKE